MRGRKLCAMKPPSGTLADLHVGTSSDGSLTGHVLQGLCASSVLLAACGPPPAGAPLVPRAAATAAAAVSALPAAPAPSVAWWLLEPIPTAVTDADGCVVSGGLSGIALSVDGEADGVFLSDVSGARGELVLVPGGRSAARVTFGAAVFDTGLALSQTTFSLSDRPAPLGGLLYPFEHTRFRVVGGDKARLSLALAGPGADKLQWLTPPKLEVPCNGLQRRGRWANEPALPEATSTVYPLTEAVTVRAQKDGPVILRITVAHAGVLETAGSAVKVSARIESAGTVIGWTDAAAWTSTPPRPPPSSDGGRGGSGRMGTTPVECPPGAPLFLHKNDRLYAVGHLRDASADPLKLDPDWRVLGPRVSLDRAMGSLPDGVPWVVLRDDFRVTNSYWHHGLMGSFVVPRGPSGCK
jgi:hypothetical protein